MGERSAQALLGLRVRLHGIVLGQPADVLLDREELKVLGLDILCGDDVHRFLPLATAELGKDGIAVSSPLVLLEEDQLGFYRSRAFALSALTGRAVERRGRKIGLLRDLVLDADLRAVAVMVEADGAEARYPYDETIRVDPGSRSAA